MNNKKKDEILDSLILGITDSKEEDQNRDSTSITDDGKKVVSEFNNLVSLLPLVLYTPEKRKSPSEKVKEKLFEKIEAVSVSNKSINKEFEFLHSTDEWLQHPIEGIKVKQLAVNYEKGYVMLLMKVAAGTEYPAHHHNGAEECYVIDGDLYAQGKILGPGDFHHADGGSDHEPLRTKNGCTVILVVDPRDT